MGLADSTHPTSIALRTRLMATRNRQLVWSGLCDIEDAQERVATIHSLLAEEPDVLGRPDRIGALALETFARCNDLILVCHLLRLGVSPDGPPGRLPTPLHASISASGGSEVLCALIAAGADLDGTTSLITPLWDAIRCERLDQAELLLANGCSVNRLCEDGETALWLAVRKQSVAACALLMKYGADPSIRETHGGRSPRDMAREIADAGIRDRLVAMLG